ncbi:uncharacterized protein LOC135937305 [Cloeon dipterum]|uniref:uncharacterized protein LOC135937305 n=1 Tax=Cloeon dipterum TaxID=197152 RepID=UPI00322025F5
MLMDNHGTMYATFWGKNYINSWNTSQPFEEQRFYEVTALNTYWPFTLSSDQIGTLWITVFDEEREPRYRLLKAAVGAKSFKASPERSSVSFPTTTKSWTPAEETATTEVQESSVFKEELNQYRLYIIILICFIVFCIVLLGLIILWLILRQKRNNSIPPNTNEAQEMSVIADNYDDVGPAEEPLYEEIKHDQAAAPAAPSLYERPIILTISPRSARRVKAMPERPRTFEKFGEAPRAPVEFEYDYVRTSQLEPLYDDVAPETSATPPGGDTTSESAQYLKIMP